MKFYSACLSKLVILIGLSGLPLNCIDSSGLENDCSAIVPSYLCNSVLQSSGTAADSRLIIYQTVATTTGGFIGPKGADSFCASNNPGVSGTYKALIVGSNVMNAPNTRIASLTANNGDGQDDWALQANTTYKRNDGTTIGTTNGNALFTFPLEGSLGTTGTYWSGMQTDWVDNGSGCNATNGEWDTTGGLGAMGDATTLSNGAIFTSTGSCNVAQSILCVQQ